jgi:signal peptidase I
VKRLPDPWRKIADWTVTLVVVIGFVLVFEAEVAQPYRIPTSSMERTLLCARPGPGCTGSMSDRVLVNKLAYDFGSPQRGQIVVFTAPLKANDCRQGDGGTTFVKRLIALPGETVREDGHGFIWIREPGAKTWTKLSAPYVSAQSRLADSEHFNQTWQVPHGAYFMVGTTAPTPATRERGARFRGPA